MSTRVVNVGGLAFTPSGQKDTKNPAAATGSQGTVNVHYENRRYTFGPNQSMVLEDGIAAALVAQDARLRVADTRDGADRGPQVS